MVVLVVVVVVVVVDDDAAAGGGGGGGGMDVNCTLGSGIKTGRTQSTHQPTLPNKPMFK